MIVNLPIIENKECLKTNVLDFLATSIDLTRYEIIGRGRSILGKLLKAFVRFLLIGGDWILQG